MEGLELRCRPITFFLWAPTSSNGSGGKKMLRVRAIGNVIVLRENVDPPADQDWDGFLDLLILNRENFDRLKILVVTDGGGPNAAQRKRLENALDGRGVHVAIVTDSAKARFITSIVRFINKRHRGFAMAEIRQAYEHLGMSWQEQKLAEQALREMESLVG
jgi:hypothetical protein